MAIHLNRKAVRDSLLEEIKENQNNNGINMDVVTGYRGPQGKRFTFGEHKGMKTKDDFIFEVYNGKISTVSLMNHLPSILNLKIFNGELYSFGNEQLKIVLEKDINSFCLKYFKELETESFMQYRMKKLMNQIPHLELRPNIIAFNNKEFDLNGEVVDSDDEYVSKITFNCKLLSQDNVKNNGEQNKLGTEYIKYVYGDIKHLFTINKTFSTIMGTDELITENMKVVFNITDGGSARTTIQNKLRSYCLIPQSKVVGKNAEHNKFQGHKELKNATQNLIDDPVEKKGKSFVITGDGLKDLTQEEFTYKGIGKDAVNEKNIVQNVVFLNKYEFKVNTDEHSELRRLDGNEIRNTKDIRTGELFTVFKETFDYEGLLSYLYGGLVDNKESILNENNEFDYNKLEDNQLFTSLLDELLNGTKKVYRMSDLKNIMNRLDVSTKKGKNKDYVHFLEKNQLELMSGFNCKFNFGVTKGVYSNFSKSTLERKEIEGEI